MHTLNSVTDVSHVDFPPNESNLTPDLLSLTITISLLQSLSGIPKVYISWKLTRTELSPMKHASQRDVVRSQQR